MSSGQAEAWPWDDAELRAGAEELRPDLDPREVVARMIWNVVAEAGDGVAGALVGALGAEDALHRAFPGGGGVSAAHGRAGDGPGVPSAPRPLRDGRARWAPRYDRRLVHRAMSAARRAGAGMLLPGDPHWPAGLADLGDHAPLVLWVRGTAEVLAETAVAIVGARAATAYGEHVAGELSAELADGGLVVVSGGAYGVDGTAHRAALRAGGRTVAVLAGGVDRVYPAGHAHLFDRIVRDGAVVSEVPCGTIPTKWRFLARNRVIGATAAATVVVEAGWRSGSLNTAGHAAALGRPLGAVPGPVTSATSAGCHRLLREYDAQCITSAADVRELLGLGLGHGPDSAHHTPEGADAACAKDGDRDALRLSDALSKRVARNSIDLAQRSGLAPARVEALLGVLELEGAARRGPEGWRSSTAAEGRG